MPQVTVHTVTVSQGFSTTYIETFVICFQALFTIALERLQLNCTCINNHIFYLVLSFSHFILDLRLQGHTLIHNRSILSQAILFLCEFRYPLLLLRPIIDFDPNKSMYERTLFLSIWYFNLNFLLYFFETYLEVNLLKSLFDFFLALLAEACSL